MCNILILKAGQMPLERTEFDNMCYNNWHSYGLVTVVDGRLDIKRVVPENGEVNPEEVWNLLLKDRQFDRYLHVRHNTSGTTSVENCHPFDVFYQDRKGKNPRQVVFMHNGTLYDYRSKTVDANGMMKDDDSGPSDTQNFVTRVLQPFFSAMDFGDGKGDLETPLLRMLLGKFWPTSGNRGLLISSDQDPLLLGDWKKMKASDGSDIVSSNDDYFKGVIRGPQKARLEEEDRKKKEADKASGKVSSFRFVPQNKGDITPYTLFDFPKPGDNGKNRHGVYDLKTTLANILDDWNVWDRECAIALGAATRDELTELVSKDPKAAVTLMDWIFSDYFNMYHELAEAEDKHKNASDRIATIMGELNELRKWCQENGYFDKKKVG